jgi:hypothetical protein
MLSLRTLALDWDVNRSTVRRLLSLAGIEPVVLGRGKNSSIRYPADEVDAYLKSRRAARYQGLQSMPARPPVPDGQHQADPTKPSGTASPANGGEEA